MKEPVPNLTPEQKQRYEAIIARFEQAWHRSGDPQISAFLSSAGELRSQLLRELVLIDREFRADEFRSSQSLIETASVDAAAAGPTAATSAPSSGQARFRILRPHAKGGLGEVFIAEDTELRRQVALKQIQRHRADDSHSRNRFVLEAEITGGLEHPGIVPIYALGADRQGRPYYAMRFIKGDTLQQAIERFHDPERVKNTTDGQRVLELRQLLSRFSDVCQAIEYAHCRGVLHRDLKPGNVMLGKYGETLVVDWGLAKVCGTPRAAAELAPAEMPLQPKSASSVEPTEMGQRIGTLHYMSPEQAAGKLDELGPATDIFALGATLYHLLTGKTPYHAASKDQLLDCVASASFPALRKVLPTVPRPLEAICLKALAKLPADRYSSAQALLDDLERYLADEPVTAYRDPITVRASRWARKRPGLVSGTAATVAVTLLALLIGTVILGQKNRELALANSAEKQQRQRAEREEATAKANEKEAREQEAIATAVKNFLLYDLLNLANPQKQAAVQDELVKIDPELRVQDLFARADDKVKLRFGNEPKVAAELRTLVVQPVSPQLTIRTLLLRASDKITGRFIAQPLVESDMRWVIGMGLQSIGEAKLAIPHLERCRDLYSQHLGSKHRGTLTSMSNLALSYRDAGRLAEAIPLLEESLKLHQSTLGTDRPDTLGLMHNLGSAYFEAGRATEAISLMEMTWTLMEAKLGRDHPSTLIAMGGLSTAYGHVGRIPDAIRLRTYPKRRLSCNAVFEFGLCL